jgi:hypothetical protein
VEGNAVYMARVMLHAVDPLTDYINNCEIVKAPDRKSSERRAKNYSNNVINQENDSENSITNYSIIPNPNSGSFELLCKSDELINCELISSTGQLIEKNTYKPTRNIIKFNFNSLDKGFYSLKIVSSNETVVLKVIVN